MKYWKLFKPGWILVFGVCAGQLLWASAQNDSIQLTLEQLFERGVTHNVQLQINRQQERMAAERGKAARMNRLPDIEVGLKGGVIGQPVVFQHGLSDAVRPDTPDWSQNYAVDFVQPLYQGGRIRYGIRKADLQCEIAALQTATNQATVKLGLLKQYVSLFSLYKQREVLRRNIEESERRLTDIRRLRKEGIITNNDVLRSELQLTNDRLSLQEAENNLILVSQQLDILLGLDEHLLVVPDTALLSRPVPIKSYGEYVSQAYVDEPSLRLARWQTEVARTEVRLAKADFLPKLSLTASNTLARPISRTMVDMYNNAWNIGVSISYPLSALYKNRSKLNELRHGVEVSLKQEEQYAQNLRLEIRTAYLHHREALDRVEALKLSVRQAEENYRIVQNQYFSQLAILTDLLDANTVRLEAELQLTTARTRVIYTYYELEKACGRL